MGEKQRNAVRWARIIFAGCLALGGSSTGFCVIRPANSDVEIGEQTDFPQVLHKGETRERGAALVANEMQETAQTPAQQNNAYPPHEDSGVGTSSPIVSNNTSSTSGFWRGLHIPPIRVWGSVAYDLRAEDVGQQRRTIENLVTTTLNASSYIWEPWFAIVSGGLGVTVSRIDDHDLAGNDHFLTGYGRLNLLPRSRFPFEAHYEVNDSRIDSGLGASASYRSTRFGVTQRYRPEQSGLQFLVSYDHNTQDATTTGKDVQDTLQFDTAHSWNKNNASLNANWSHNRRLSTDEETSYRTLVARHSYAPSSALSVETVANWTETDFALRLFDTTTRFLQLSSIAFWRDPSRPLTVTSSARLFSLSTAADGDTLDSRQMSGTVGAVYLVNQNLRVTGNMSLTRTDTGRENFTTTNESVGATYQGDTKALGNFSYDWFAGTTLSYTSGGVNESGFIGAGQVGHSVARSYTLGENSRLNITFGQNVAAQTGAIADENSASTRQLVHYGSVTWSKLEGETSTFVRLNASDSRFLDGRKERFQLINLQATRARELSQHSSWAGNLTIQAIRQQSQLEGVTVTPDRGFVTLASADLTYQHLKAFGVPRLRFFSQIRINRDDALQVLGEPINREQKSWENRLDYSIGRLESRLTLRIAEIDNERRWLLMWRLIRYFGE